MVGGFVECCSFMCLAILPLNHRGSPSGVYPHNLQLLSDLIFAVGEEEDAAGAGEGGEFAAVEVACTEFVSAGVGSGSGFKVPGSMVFGRHEKSKGCPASNGPIGLKLKLFGDMALKNSSISSKPSCVTELF